VAMSRELESRRVPLGRYLGQLFRSTEGWLLRSANAIVAVTDDFIPELRRRGSTSPVARLWRIGRRSRSSGSGRTPGARAGLDGTFAFVYSGTLGLMHNPDVLNALAERFDQGQADVIVVSEGIGIDRMRDLQSRRPLPNLRLLPFQPYAALPDVLGSADVLLVLSKLRPGDFSCHQWR
jgi:hypothetical protein